MHLAARKLPKAGHRLAGRALRDQHAAVDIHQGTGDDQDEAALARDAQDR
jgi:hypothetical protein